MEPTRYRLMYLIFNFSDETLSPCDRMKRALSGYSQLADGLILHTNYVAEGADAMISERNANIENLRIARSNIEASGKCLEQQE